MRFQHLALAAGLFALLPGTASACIILGPTQAKIGVDQEKAIIIWDARTHTEHFIRQAEFRSDAGDFGFVVPTPTPPSLKAANPAVFSAIESRIFPATRATLSAVPGAAHAPGAITKQVEIVSRQNVAGYEATVLKAKDTGALVQWLAKNGYQHGPALNGWLKPYVSQGWAVTAFKVKRIDGRLNAAKLAPVRMTFRADAPFYPYREPVVAQVPGVTPAPRLLRVFYIGTEQAAGSLGHSVAWPGRRIWSNPLAKVSGGALLADTIASDVALRPIDLPKNAWLTVFDDRSSPRPAIADVYFHASAARNQVARR